MSAPSSENFNSSHGEDTRNLNGVGSFSVDSSIRNYESNTMFISANQTNHHGLFSSSRSINHYQSSSHVSSSSFGSNNPFVPNYQMRNNMVSNAINYSPMNNNSQFSRVSITQTITNRYTAIVPTSSLVTSQNEFDRGTNPTNLINPSFHSQNFVDNQREILNPTPLISVDNRPGILTPSPFNSVDNQHEISILNPIRFNSVDNQREISNPIRFNFIDNQREILNRSTPLNFVDNQREILNPTPPNTSQPHQDTVFPRQQGNNISFSPEHHPDQHVPHPRPVKKRSNPGRADGEYDGRTHSLPYKKNGPYTCPRCERVFDTSQKFAAHVASAHYKNESIEQRATRIKAKYKNKRKVGQTSNEEPQEVQPENGGNNNIPSDVEVAQPQPIVKEEPI